MNDKTGQEIFRRPGVLEAGVAFAIYIIGIAGLGYWMVEVAEAQAIFRINVAGIGNGAIGLLALLAAYSLRVRNWQAFGFRATSGKWVLMSFGLGVLAFGLSFIVEGIYFHFVTEANTQGDFQAAAKEGIGQLALILFTGAVLGPIGEELVFRGVVATALHRWGAWVSVVGSSFLFALVHGPSVIFFDALLVGLLMGAVFVRSRSIWTPILIHIVYNGLQISYYSTL